MLYTLKITLCSFISQQMKYSFPQRYADSYVEALVHFVDAVEGRIPQCLITKEETESAGKLATLAENSWLEGKVMYFRK